MSRPIAEDTATQALPMRLFRGAQDRRHAKALQDQLELIEAGLLENLGFASAVADAPARYLLDAGGKRIRPMLTLLASELGEGPNELVRQAAQAVEITHLASLYHDDVMDDAKLRRGAKSANARWDNSVAILTGDFLFARGLYVVGRTLQHALETECGLRGAPVVFRKARD